MTRKLTMAELKEALDTQILIKQVDTTKLVYFPKEMMFKVYYETDLDSIYSTFGTQMAMNRFNELIGEI